MSGVSVHKAYADMPRFLVEIACPDNAQGGVYVSAVPTLDPKRETSGLECLPRLL